KGAAANKDGVVTLKGLAGYVRDEVPTRVKDEVSNLTRQTPTVLGEAAEGVALAREGGDAPPPPPPPPGMNEKQVVNSIGLKLVLIAAGKFKMGTPATEDKRDDDEDPIREVTITRPFYLGVYEVTQGQYERVMKANPSRFKGDPNHPVENIS